MLLAAYLSLLSNQSIKTNLLINKENKFILYLNPHIFFLLTLTTLGRGPQLRQVLPPHFGRDFGVGGVGIRAVGRRNSSLQGAPTRAGHGEFTQHAFVPPLRLYYA
jgi:hypothetical protein